MVEQNKNNALLRIVYWIVGLFGAFILITLLAALLPKLSSMEGVYDIDKRNDLKQVEQALVRYRLENGKYPLSGGGFTTIENELKFEQKFNQKYSGIFKVFRCNFVRQLILI